MRTFEKAMMTVQRASCIEMRREPRVEVSEFALVHLLENDRQASAISVPGMLTDLSVAGLGMVLPRALKAGQCFRVELSSGDSFSDAQYVVVHCHRMRGGMYAVGAKQCTGNNGTAQ